jgi:hypothetical protein
MLKGMVAIEHKEILRRSTPNPVAGAVVAEFRIDTRSIDVVLAADLASMATRIFSNHHLFLSLSVKMERNQIEERKDFLRIPGLKSFKCQPHLSRRSSSGRWQQLQKRSHIPATLILPVLIASIGCSFTRGRLGTKQMSDILLL